MGSSDWPLTSALRRAEIDFERVDLSASKEARQHIQALGYQQAPIIIAGNLHWSGINPEKLRELRELRELIATQNAQALA